MKMHHPGLALPLLGPDVPMDLRLCGTLSAHAQLACLLHEAGMLHRRDIGSGDAIEACRTALDGWLRRQLGPLDRIEPHLAMGVDYTGDKQLDGIRFQWGSAGCLRWDIEPGLRALEQAVKGLAPSVIEALEHQWIYPVFTPRTAYNETVECDWYGEHNEKVFLDDHCETAEEREAMRRDIITKRDFVRAFPRWMLRRCLQPVVLDDAALQALLPAGGVVAHAAQAVLTLRATTALRHAHCGDWGMARSKDAQDDDEEVPTTFYGWGALLMIGDAEGMGDGITRRVFDERCNDGMQADYSTDVVSRAWFGAHEAQALRDWQRALRPHFAAVRAIDRLICCLTGPD